MSVLVTVTQFSYVYHSRLRRFSDHMFSTRTSQTKRSANFESGKCPLVPGGLGQLVCQALNLDQHQPYLLLWACFACRDGASHLDVLALLGALGYTPLFRWTDPGQGREVFNPVSIVDSTFLYLGGFTYLYRLSLSGRMGTPPTGL